MKATPPAQRSTRKTRESFDVSRAVEDEQELDPTSLGEQLAMAAYTQAVALYDSCVEHATPRCRNRDTTSSTQARDEVSNVVRRW